MKIHGWGTRVFGNILVIHNEVFAVIFTDTQKINSTPNNSITPKLKLKATPDECQDCVVRYNPRSCRR